MENKIGQIGSKTGDSDPGVGSNPQARKVQQSQSLRRNPHVESVCKFLSKVKGTTISEEEVLQLANKAQILDILRYMKGRCFGGWKRGDDCFINENLQTADLESWDLVNGFLKHKEGKSYDFDLIYDAIRMLESVTPEPVLENSDPDPEEVRLFKELIFRRLDIE
jgi:hypothetical protein